MRRLLATVRLAAAILGWVASLLPLAATAQARFSSSAYHFSFAPPAGWVQTQHPPAVAAFLEPAKEPPTVYRLHESNREFINRVKRSLQSGANGTSAKARASISCLYVDTAVSSLDAYSKDARARMAKIKGCKVLGMRKVTLAGRPAIEHTVRLALPNEPVTESREVIAMDQGRAFAITLVSPVGRFPQMSKVFDKVLSSFRWSS